VRLGTARVAYPPLASRHWPERAFSVSAPQTPTLDLNSSPFESATSTLAGAAAEPSFQSIGLAHAYPSGWLQSVMELMHVQAGLPWWATIVASECYPALAVLTCPFLATVSLRLLLFPVTILAHKNMIKMNNHLPEMQKIQVKSFTGKTKDDSKC